MILAEFVRVAVERGQRRLGRTSPRLLRVAMGTLLPALGCEPATRASSFAEPDSGRPYRVVARSDHDAKRPSAVLVSLHAYATHPDIVVDGYSLVRNAVEARDWLLVVPQGRKDGKGQFHWNATAACCGEAPRDADDVGYLRAVLRDVKSRYAVDGDRVVAFGVSNGAFMAYRWACAPGGDLSAVVAIAGAAPGVDDPPCTAERAISVVHVHGKKDALIRYEGGTEPGHAYPSADATVARWVAVAGITALPSVTRRRSLFLDHVEIRRWVSAQTRLASWTFEDGDHSLRDARFFTPEFLDFVLPR